MFKSIVSFLGNFEEQNGKVCHGNGRISPHFILVLAVLLGACASAPGAGNVVGDPWAQAAVCAAWLTGLPPAGPPAIEIRTTEEILAESDRRGGNAAFRASGLYLPPEHPETDPTVWVIQNASQALRVHEMTHHLQHEAGVYGRLGQTGREAQAEHARAKVWRCNYEIFIAGAGRR